METGGRARPSSACTCVVTACTPPNSTPGAPSHTKPPSLRWAEPQRRASAATSSARFGGSNARSCARTRRSRRPPRCWCSKIQCVVRGRGRRHEPKERQMILDLVREARAAGARRVRVASSSRSTSGPFNAGSNTAPRAAKMAVEAPRPCRRTSSARSSERRSSTW